MNSPVRYMTVTYILALSFVAVLLAVTYVILDTIVAIQSSSAEKINVSGQQRMLSQRTSLFTYDFILTGKPESKNLALEAINRMLSNHEFLLSDFKNARAEGEDSLLSSVLEAMYFEPPLEVEAKIDRFENAVFRALNSNEQQLTDGYNRFEFLELSREPLLAALDAVVKQYEVETTKQVSDLRRYLTLSSIALLCSLMFIAVFIFRPMVNRISSYANKIERDASIDFLSGLLNRRAFYLLAKRAQLVSKRYNRPTSAILIDIDHFKKINDSYGHEVGDETIKYLSSIIDNFFRTSDIVARFGGEEFVVLLQETNLHQAYLVAERLRAHIASSPFTLDGKAITLTVSCGVSTSKGSNENADEIISRADLALYEAKESGRNKVVGKPMDEQKSQEIGPPLASLN